MQVKFSPTEKKGGGGGKRFSHVEVEGGGGGGTTSFEVVLTRELEVLAMGIAKSFHPLKVEGVANKSFGPITSPFCCPPYP